MAVNIELGNYRITTNELNWILSRKRGKRWQALYYYSSLPALLHGLGEQKLRELTAASVKELSENCEEVKQKLEEIKEQLKISD